jgi:hypothetical protein
MTALTIKRNGAKKPLISGRRPDMTTPWKAYTANERRKCLSRCPVLSDQSDRPLRFEYLLSVELTPTRLVMLSRNLPHDWQEQRRLLGFAPA